MTNANVETTATMGVTPIKVKSDDLRVPIPLYRHAAPSAPWPWMDLKRDDAEVRGIGGATSDSTWRGYPQSLFGNWTGEQVGRCRMFEVMKDEGGRGCVVYHVDVFRGGVFRVESQGGDEHVGEDENAREAFWMRLGGSRDPGVRLRALFVERMSGPVLQMLGTRYNVEPFFFSSSANWIPSRYQEDAQPGRGDHITVVLPFVRVIRSELVNDEDGVIDTQAPLHLSDLLAIHMIRTTSSDTILSYHPDSALRKGSAARLRSLLRRTGESVYWSKLYKKCNDPTIVLLALLWHAVYAWDEALEMSYDYLNKTLEARALTTEHNTHTRELHKVRAHLICYQQLLREFRESVVFVKRTANPAMGAVSVTEGERRKAAIIVQSEADHLLGEIERLEKQRGIQTDRVGNAMSLAFSTVKNEDTKAIHRLTSATVRDAAILKQISYFTLVFLPGYYMAGIFRMDVKEVNPNGALTLVQYIEGTIIFTFCTAWLAIALQNPSAFHPGGRHVIRRVVWPAFYAYGMVLRVLGRDRDEKWS